MLDGDVLTQLTTSTPLQAYLLEAAWPSLSVESKLQVVNTAARKNARLIPNCLSELGMADEAPIVRYWTARFSWFRRPSPNKEFESLFPVSEKEAQLSARADNDSSALVRAAAEGVEESLSNNLAELSQLERLLSLRNHRHENSRGLAEFLTSSLEKGDPSQDELRECLFEYFESDTFRTMFDELHADGYGEYSKQRGIESLWELAASAPLEIAAPLAAHLPLSGAYWKLDQKFLDQLPNEVICHALWRQDAPIETFRANVRDNPTLYDAKLVEEVKRFGEAEAEFGDVEECERRAIRARQAPDRELAILDLVLALSAQLQEMKQGLAEFTETSSGKKGWFR